MEEDPLKELKQLMAENTGGPKDPLGSARRKYNRRKKSLAHELHQMQIAIDNLCAQSGNIYKRDEIDTLNAAIDEFIEKTGLAAPKQVSPSHSELDAMFDMLCNSKPWEPPSRESLLSLFSELGLSDTDDEDGHDAEDQNPAPST